MKTISSRPDHASGEISIAEAFTILFQAISKHVKQNKDIIALGIASPGVLLLKIAPVFGLLILVCAVGMALSSSQKGGKK